MCERPRGFGDGRTARVGSDDDGMALGVGVGAPEGVKGAASAAVGGPEAGEEDLVFVVVDLRAEQAFELDALSGAELAAEDGELEVIAVATHEVVYPAEALWVGDVVGDEVGGAHGGASAGAYHRDAVYLAEEEAAYEPCLDLESAPVADTVAKDRVGEQLVHAPLVGEDDALAGRAA